MRRLAIITVQFLLVTSAASAQNKVDSPSATVVTFYQALKARRYVEGFRHSVYRGAVEGLAAGELQDLEPDFARTFSAIPEKIEVRGQQVLGDTAVVFLKFEGIEDLQQVGLVRVNGEWLVGDQEALALVQKQGRAFFFNTRILVNEGETVEMLTRIIGAELIYSQKFQGTHASLQELVRLNGVSKDLEDQEASGYRYSLTLSQDQKSFFVTATPAVYGKAGRLSFFADINGVRAEDLKGQPATARSPIYRPQ